MDLESLLQQENRCIQESAAPCVARCPLHVEAREMLIHAAKGDWKAAYHAMKRRMPFPQIIARVCDHPCEGACVRKERGGAIVIGGLETVIAEKGATPARLPGPLPKKEKRAAVVGGGISGMTVAWELRKKGYPVTLFETGSRLGGRLWELVDTRLPRQVLEEELAGLVQLKTEIHYHHPVSGQELLKLAEDYDGVYLGTGQWPEALQIDPVTFQTQYDKVFAAGRLIQEKGSSLIESFATGKRTAISMDRFMSRVSLQASREKEGAYETDLRVNLEEIDQEPPSQAFARFAEHRDAKNGPNLREMILDEATARQEADRCIRCECLECTKACLFMRRFGSYPKRYIRQVYNNEAIVMGKRAANSLINSCSLCGQCGQACPVDLNMKPIFQGARERMVEKGKMPPSAHDFALGDYTFNQSDRFRLHRHQPGMETSQVAFFPGCQLCGSEPGYVEILYQAMVREGSGIGLMLGCCGAPAEWAGERALFQEGLSQVKTQWEEMGKPTLILACATCYDVFSESLPQVPVISLWEWLLKQEAPEQPTGDSSSQSMVFSIHDACRSRNYPKIYESVRHLVTRQGHTIEELKHSRELTSCCGYGGLQYFANRELAEAVIQERMQETDHPYVAYCAMCRDLFAGKGKPTLHLLDLLYGTDLQAQAIKPPPTFSERHENRTRLKLSLLKKLWKEEMEMEPDFSGQLLLSDEVAEKMERRLILIKDLQQAIRYGEETGRCFVHGETGHFLVSWRGSHVTYWVEYEKTDEGYLVHNAYSHRMEILEEEP